MKIVINKCYGGFGLSDAAYEKLIEYGVPVRAYVEERREENTGLYSPEPSNDGEIIFDDQLRPDPSKISGAVRRLRGTRYWDTWTRRNRTHALIVRVVEELGSQAASGPLAELKIVEVPDGIEWEIDEYDGIEKVAQVHQTWS